MRKKATKLDAIYYSVGNLPRNYRSATQSIRLCMLVKSSTLKTLGYDAVFAPLINDLQILESTGVYVPFLHRNVRGTVAICSCDNLGAHSVGGYNESFAGNVLRICRTCNATSDLIQSLHAESFVLRTKADYDSQILKFEQGLTDSTTYGIKRRCCFNRLQFAHAIDILPPDISHDVAEGLIPFTLSPAIEYFVNKKYFSIDQLNIRLKTFDFGLLDKRNIRDFIDPNFMRKHSGIGGSATKNMYLLRFMPFLLGEFVPPEDLIWQLVLECWDLVMVIYSEVFTDALIYYLDALIKSFRAHWSQLFKVAVQGTVIFFQPKFFPL